MLLVVTYRSELSLSSFQCRSSIYNLLTEPDIAFNEESNHFFFNCKNNFFLFVINIVRMFKTAMLQQKQLTDLYLFGSIYFRPVIQNQFCKINSIEIYHCYSVCSAPILYGYFHFPLNQITQE